MGLSALLPLLGCGEEAASMAFDGLARCNRGDVTVAETLHAIADEERVHDRLIRHVQDSLPVLPLDEAMLAKMRRFHIGLVRGGPARHLARIAALDSAVCTIFARVLHADNAVNEDAAIGPILRRIHRDEARHVRISRALVLHHKPDPAIRDGACMARNRLADMLALVGDAFEKLGVDPTLLERDIRRLPDGLLTS